MFGNSYTHPAVYGALQLLVLLVIATNALGCGLLIFILTASLPATVATTTATAWFTTTCMKGILK